MSGDPSASVPAKPSTPTAAPSAGPAATTQSEGATVDVIFPTRYLGLPLSVISAPDDYPIPKTGQRGMAIEYAASREELEKVRLQRRAERMAVETRAWNTQSRSLGFIVAASFIGGWAALWYIGNHLSSFSANWLAVGAVFTLIVAIVAAVAWMRVSTRHRNTIFDIDSGADELVDHHQDRMIDLRMREEELYRDRDARIMTKQKADRDAILEAERIKIEHDKVLGETERRRAKIQTTAMIESKRIDLEVLKQNDAARMAQQQFDAVQKRAAERAEAAKQRADLRAQLAKQKAELAAKKADLEAEKLRQRRELIAIQHEKAKAAARAPARPARAAANPRQRITITATPAPGATAATNAPGTRVFEGTVKETPAPPPPPPPPPPPSGRNTKQSSN